MKRNSILKKNNKGIAMVTIMITIMFLAIIATTLLYISTTNYMMKVTNLAGKENFYETDGILIQTSSGIRNLTMKTSNPINGIDQLRVDPTDNTSGYSMLKLAQLVYPSAVAGATGGATSATYAPAVNTDVILFKTTDNHIYKTEDATTPGVTTYTLRDIQIIQTSAEGYQNSVKTDLRFDIYEKVTPGGSAGGVGNMSMMLDAPLSTSSEDFKCLTMTGNCFMADYGGNAAWAEGDGNTYVTPGLNGLVMSNECRLNLKGTNNVVYGDVKLSGNSTLAIYGDLTVYGDIVVSGNATIIASDGAHIYQLKSKGLPGRPGSPSVFNVPAHNKYPSTLTSEEVTEQNFKDFAKTIGINLTVNTSGEYGLINKIFVKHSSLGNKRVIDLTCDNITTYTTITGLDQNNYDLSRGYFLKNNIYNMDKFGCAFIPHVNNTNNMNGCSNDSYTIGEKYDHKLMISMATSDLVMQNSNPYSTWISKTPVHCTQAHCITLSKVGSDQFNYMTAGKGDAESAAYNNNDNPFNHTKFDFGSNTFNGKFGELFDTNCNAYVDQMFGYSVPGGTSGSTTYASAMNFTNYTRDFADD